MEPNKIKNIKEREKFLEFKDFKAERGSTRKIKLSCINEYFRIDSKIIIITNTGKITFDYGNFEKADKLISKIDTFFNISKI